jgi:hypothetical protein
MQLRFHLQLIFMRQSILSKSSFVVSCALSVSSFCDHYLFHMVYAMKRPDFGDVLKIRKLCIFFKVLGVSCLLQELKFPPKFLGYLTGHCWVTPTVLK